MNSIRSPKLSSDNVSRQNVMTILNTALRLRETQFVRQVILNWLAAYPGDIYFNYLYARSLFEDGKVDLSISILESVEKTDPEFMDAYSLHTRALVGLAKQDSKVSGSFFALSGQKVEPYTIPLWATQYRQAIQSSEKGNLQDAEILIQQALITDPTQVLPAIFHLQVIKQTQDASSYENLANLYHARWPDCLYFYYALATSALQHGMDSEAVALLHTCVTKDNAGQVAERLFPAGNPYRSLWPELQSVKMDFAVPEKIASALGWNQLAAGQSTGKQPVEAGRYPVAETYPAPAASQLTADYTNNTRPEAPQATGKLTSKHWTELSPSEVLHQADRSEEDFQNKAVPDSGIKKAPKIKPQQAKHWTEKSPVEILAESNHETTKDINTELTRIASRLRLQDSTLADRRFPVYVIFTTRKGLENQYGAQTAFLLDELMKQLVSVIRNKNGWSAMVFYADDAACTTSLGIKPAQYNNAWKLKLAISDLDKALSKKGEMIGTLLIIGGPEIVPFHMLPNPTDDADAQVASDNPYASTDENYFIPEWPIGRLPGGTGNDPGVIMRALRQMSADYSSSNTSAPWWTRISFLLPFLRNMQRAVSPRNIAVSHPAFGYSASVWKQASTEVFRQIGDSQSMLSSPPVKTGELVGTGIFPARLSYYNLHGTATSAEWYGQPDSQTMQTKPEYPVALSPEDLKKSSTSPLIVFSEACYGANIENKAIDEAISLKFLANGTRAMVGSSCIAYGSISTPLIAADRLAYEFWRQVKNGCTAGEALRNSKIALAKDLNATQGFLDGEDQKTLLSFILYGDPWAKLPGSEKKKEKTFVRENVDFQFAITSERDIDAVSDKGLFTDKMGQVKSIVEQYLPNWKFDNYSVAMRQMDVKTLTKLGPGMSSRTVVVVSKALRVQSQDHVHYARVTLDNSGKVIKLAVSR